MATDRVAFFWEHGSHASQVDGDDGNAGALREVGGAAAKLLSPSVGGAAALGKDHEAPSRFDEVGGEIGGFAIELRPLHWDRAEQSDHNAAFHGRSKK